MSTSVRSLVYIPIIHSQTDMGDLSVSIKKFLYRKRGERAWKHKEKLIEGIWMDIEKAIDKLGLPYERVRLYQDGLPVCGREREIVTELAKAGSRNYEFLLRLMEKGAMLMGTESSELLVEEYQLFKNLLSHTPSGSAVCLTLAQKELGDSLLHKRDQFIAERINRTLLPGETGILFLGMLHKLESFLEQNIQLVFPIKLTAARDG